MTMLKSKSSLLAALAVLFSLGLTPVAKAYVEMQIDPYAIFTSPGRQVNYTGTIMNHDPVPYDCLLTKELWCPNGYIIHYPDLYFRLRPGQTITREVTRGVPETAPVGEYILWYLLYDRTTGGLLATTHVHIFVGWSPP